MNKNVILTGHIGCNNEGRVLSLFLFLLRKRKAYNLFLTIHTLYYYLAIKWQSNQQTLQDLYLVGHNSESTTCGKFNVTYQAEFIIPLNAIKLYTLTQTRFRVYTKSLELKEYFTQVFKPTSFTNQSKYAIVLNVKRAENKIDDPFNENEMNYPLDYKSYILLYGQKIKQDQSITFQIYGQLIRDHLNYIDLYRFSTHITSHSIKTKGTKRTSISIDKSTLQTYRPDIPFIKRDSLLSTPLSSLPPSPSDNNNNEGDDNNNLLLKRGMSKLKQLDILREEARKQRPERTLIVTKRKISSIRKSNANIPFLQSPNPLSQPKQQSLLALSQSSSSQPILTLDKPISSTTTTTRHESNNKKQLKLAIWSKLLLLGHDKKAEDTKLFYHSIYQSIQFVTRKTFKDAPLDTQLMNQLIDKHIQFYDSLDSELINNSIQ
ncbi:unnamed protein product [Cunninghamella blakesleeana]